MFRIVSNNITFFSNYKNINKLEKLIIFHGLGGEAIDFLFLTNLNLKKIQVLVAILPGQSNQFSTTVELMNTSRQVRDRFTPVESQCYFEGELWLKRGSIA